MAVEAARGCGFRRVGGIYIVTDGLGEPCERLPLPIDACPTCGAGIKQTRSFQWINPELIFKNPKIKPCKSSSDKQAENASYFQVHCHRCVICTPGLLESQADPPDQIGLIWVGEKYYPKADDWAREAAKMGVSKRIAAIPKGLVVGKTWVFVAHPNAIRHEKEITEPGELLGKKLITYSPGVFHAFVPTRIELIVTPSMEKEEWVKKMVEKQGVTLVRVPEDDPDHAPKIRKSDRRKAMERAAEKAEEAEE